MSLVVAVGRVEVTRFVVGAVVVRVVGGTAIVVVTVCCCS